jgi:hypothetical protein
MSVETQSSLDMLASAVASTSGPISNVPGAAEQTSEQSELAAAAEYNRKRAAEENLDSQLGKRSRIEGEVSPNASQIANDQSIVDQVRLSVKLKEQQEALINARRGSGPHSAQPSLGQTLTCPPSGHKLPSPHRVNTLPSPRAQQGFRNGNMHRAPNGNGNYLTSPRLSNKSLSIWTEAPFASSPTAKSGIQSGFPKPFSANGIFSSNGTPGQGQQPNISPPSASFFSRRRPSSMMNSSSQKGQFMQFCEALFDSYEMSENLCMTLQEQSQKASTMINALRSSGNTIEALVSKHFNAHQQKTTERLAQALFDLNRRTKVLEEKLEVSARSNSPLSTTSSRKTPSPKLESVKSVDQ